MLWPNTRTGLGVVANLSLSHFSAQSLLRHSSSPSPYDRVYHFNTASYHILISTVLMPLVRYDKHFEVHCLRNPIVRYSTNPWLCQGLWSKLFRELSPKDHHHSSVLIFTGEIELPLNKTPKCSKFNKFATLKNIPDLQGNCSVPLVNMFDQKVLTGWWPLFTVKEGEKIQAVR